MARKTIFRIELLLWDITDAGTDEEDADVMEEEDFWGDYTDEIEARAAYNKLLEELISQR